MVKANHLPGGREDDQDLLARSIRAREEGVQIPNCHGNGPSSSSDEDSLVKQGDRGDDLSLEEAISFLPSIMRLEDMDLMILGGCYHFKRPVAV